MDEAERVTAGVKGDAVQQHRMEPTRLTVRADFYALELPLDPLAS